MTLGQIGYRFLFPAIFYTSEVFQKGYQSNKINSIGFQIETHPKIIMPSRRIVIGPEELVIGKLCAVPIHDTRNN